MFKTTANVQSNSKCSKQQQITVITNTSYFLHEFLQIQFSAGQHVQKSWRNHRLRKCRVSVLSFTTNSAFILEFDNAECFSLQQMYTL